MCSHRAVGSAQGWLECIKRQAVASIMPPLCLICPWKVLQGLESLALLDRTEYFLGGGVMLQYIEAVNAAYDSCPFVFCRSLRPQRSRWGLLNAAGILERGLLMAIPMGCQACIDQLAVLPQHW